MGPLDSPEEVPIRAPRSIAGAPAEIVAAGGRAPVLARAQRRADPGVARCLAARRHRAPRGCGGRDPDAGRGGAAARRAPAQPTRAAARGDGDHRPGPHRARAGTARHARAPRRGGHRRPARRTGRRRVSPGRARRDGRSRGGLHRARAVGSHLAAAQRSRGTTPGPCHRAVRLVAHPPVDRGPAHLWLPAGAGSGRRARDPVEPGAGAAGDAPVDRLRPAGDGAAGDVRRQRLAPARRRWHGAQDHRDHAGADRARLERRRRRWAGARRRGGRAADLGGGGRRRNRGHDDGRDHRERSRPSSTRPTGCSRAATTGVRWMPTAGCSSARPMGRRRRACWRSWCRARRTWTRPTTWRARSSRASPRRRCRCWCARSPPPSTASRRWPPTPTSRSRPSRAGATRTRT